MSIKYLIFEIINKTIKMQTLNNKMQAWIPIEFHVIIVLKSLVFRVLKKKILSKFISVIFVKFEPKMMMIS